MDLILVRHADAAEATTSQSDGERPLTAEGRRRAQEVGAALLKHGVRLRTILSSPLVRAVETAELLAVVGGFPGALEIASELGPDGAPAAMRALIERVREAPVALVGHEPSMGALLAALVGARRLSLSKGAAVRLRYRPDGAPAELVWAITPKRLQPTASLDAI
jgi:phosphohistidine phosphatase